MSTFNQKPQLHVSMLNMLSRCGIQFQRRYGARFGVWDQEEILPPSVALVVGSSVHHAVEANLKSKMENKTLLPTEEIQALVADRVKEIWDGGMMLTEDEAENLQKTYGDTTDQAVGLVILHHNEVAPIIEPLAVEERFVIEMPGYPIDLSGTKDIRTADAIEDTKTSKRSPAKDAALSTQMAMYSLSEKMERGALPDIVRLRYLVKTKTPKVVTVEAKPEMIWIEPLLKRIERFIKIIEAVKAGHEAFTPADPNEWACTRTYCGYYDTCPFKSGK